MTQFLRYSGSFGEIYDSFRWKLPSVYNLAHDVCDRHAADPTRIALVHQAGDDVRTYTFRDIQRRGNQFANLATELGLVCGDRVMIYLPQDPAVGMVHVGCWKAGLISLPTSTLFGVDGLEYRLQNSGAKLVVTNLENVQKVLDVRAACPELRHILVVDAAVGGARPFYETLDKASDAFTNLQLTPDTPAMINYTSGTTGWPKGTLQAHRIMIGHSPGVELLYDFLPQDGDLLWSPADWAWLGGLMMVLMTGWFHGRPVLTFPMQGFDAELTMAMMGRNRVRNAFLTPTMLKLLHPVGHLARKENVQLRSIVSGSEAVGRDLLDAMNGVFGASINEGFGQTEANALLGNCSSLDHCRIGSIGTALPGHRAAIMNEEGEIVGPGEAGHLVIHRDDPVIMLEYWRDKQATEDKFRGDWLLTGDMAVQDADGFFWFQGRADDVITSSGYRIGPTEIEDAILRHPAVRLVAVIGVPDKQRTELIRAYVVLHEDRQGSEALAEEIRTSVRDRLAKHEYPREIRFVSALPMTTTGKILRRTLRQEAIEEGRAKAS